MARAKVTARDTTASGDSLIDTFQVFYFGVDLPAADSSTITVTTGPTDTIAMVETAIVDAVMAEAARLGYALVRTRIAIPVYKRGS